MPDASKGSISTDEFIKLASQLGLFVSSPEPFSRDRMSKGEHSVVGYVNEKTKRISATARKKSGARLHEVNDQMARKGFRSDIVAEGLEKREAEERRDKWIEEHLAKGYTYETRPQLSY